MPADPRGADPFARIEAGWTHGSRAARRAALPLISNRRLLGLVLAALAAVLFILRG